MSPTILKQTILSTNPPDIFLYGDSSKSSKNLFWNIHRANEILRNFTPMVQQRDTGPPTWWWWFCWGNLQDSLEGAPETDVNERDSTKNANNCSKSRKSLSILTKTFSLLKDQCSEKQNGGISAVTVGPAQVQMYGVAVSVYCTKQQKAMWLFLFNNRMSSFI